MKVASPLKLLLIPILFLSCEGKEGKEDQGGERAQEIVDEALKTHGAETLKADTVSFTFRGDRYLHVRSKDNFYYQRRSSSSDSEKIKDLLTNDGFSRYKNGAKIELSEEERSKYRETLNSVIYFAFLPYRLNDAAAIKEYRGTERIGDDTYHRVRVTFRKEGGGQDHQDIFLYWFRKSDKRMDFFAYKYFRDGGGVRFREAYNRRKIDGLLIQDHKNYKAPPDQELHKLDEAWEQGELEQVSTIEMENVRVR